MKWFKSTITAPSQGKGLYNLTARIVEQVIEWEIKEGMCHLFIQHTSASLVMNESYDPKARHDLEGFMDRLVPEDQDWFKHTDEGAEDSPSHMRSIITNTCLSIPIDNGTLSLGTWQGIYLFEHRNISYPRKVLLRCMSID